ncbi:MAG: hypothetical protein ACXAC5_00085 [Promethearchaeota archaeon]|jgi:hypothetical protein
MDLQTIINAQKKHEKSLIQKANVVSVGCGYHFKDGKQTEDIGIVVGVTDKLPVATLSAADVIPSAVDGVAVDVLKTGIVKSHQTIDPTKKHRPAMPGISIGHKDITAGTFGCVVERGGAKLILSNNHVLANSNDARIGDPLYQPGPIDGGTAADQIGTLFDFVPIQFGDEPGPTCPFARGTAKVANIMAASLRRKHRLVAFNTDPMATTNKVDAALGLPNEETDIIEEIVQIGKPVGTTVATLGMDVQKFGRTTLYTTGSLMQVNVTVRVSYGPGKTAMFVGQLMAGAMSAGGDSGSACLNMDNQLVGLLYAGSDITTIFNPIQDVFSELTITLPGGGPPVT